MQERIKQNLFDNQVIIKDQESSLPSSAVYKDNYFIQEHNAYLKQFLDKVQASLQNLEHVQLYQRKYYVVFAIELVTVLCEKEFLNEHLFVYVRPLLEFILTFNDQHLAAEDCQEISDQINDSILSLSCYNYEKKQLAYLLDFSRNQIHDRNSYWAVRLKNLKFYNFLYYSNIY